MATPGLSFGVIADCQYADAPTLGTQVPGSTFKSQRHFRKSPFKLKQAITDFNRHELAFIVHLGDLIDRNINDAAKMMDIFSEAAAPVWQVLGNHDFKGSEGNVDQVLTAFGLTSRYYSRQLEGFRFIILDTNELGVIEHAKETPAWHQGMAYIQQLRDIGADNAHEWNGGLSDTQLAWFESELALATTEGEKVVVFAHHPTFPPNIHNIFNQTTVLNLIDRYGILAYFNGHNHEGNYGVRSSVPYFTIPAVVEGDDNAYAVVQIYANSMEIIGTGRQKSLKVAF